MYTEQVLGLNYFLMPVLESFRHMVCFDDVAVLQVGDGAGKLEDAMEGTAGEMKLLHGSAKQTLRR